MKLSPHFSLDEFTDSDTALRLGIDNSLPDNLLQTAKETAEMMEGIRGFLIGLPIIVSSGYRCLQLNSAIGSSSTSHHILMKAIDFKAPEYGSPYDICVALVDQMDKLGIGQMIQEHSWVHVSAKMPSKLINRVLTLRGGGYIVGVHK
jgi:zinc D-Ala-D-Ala carboxypeptidase